MQKKREHLEVVRKELIKKLLELLRSFYEQKYFENTIVFRSIIKANKFSEDFDIDIAFMGLSDENFLLHVDFFPSYRGMWTLYSLKNVILKRK